LDKIIKEPTLKISYVVLDSKLEKQEYYIEDHTKTITSMFAFTCFSNFREAYEMYYEFSEKS
jgi:hypothetical protein